MRNKSTIAIVVFLLIFSCGKQASTNVKEDIIGKWESNDESLVLEFTNEGKVNAERKQEHFTNTTTSDLIFIDDNHIVGVWEFNIATWEVNIYGDKMTLVRDDGEKLKLNRII